MGEVVEILQKGLEAEYRGRTALRMRVLVKNGGEEVVEGASLHYVIRLGGRVIRAVDGNLPVLRPGETVEGAGVLVMLFDVPEAQALVIEAEVRRREAVWRQAWETVVRPTSGSEG